MLERRRQKDFKITVIKIIAESREVEVKSTNVATKEQWSGEKRRKRQGADIQTPGRHEDDSIIIISGIKMFASDRQARKRDKETQQMQDRTSSRSSRESRTLISLTPT